MAEASIYALYDEQIAALPATEQLRLVALIVTQLANKGVETKSPRNILALAGLGVDNPVGKDAQEYVNTLREEWDHRP
jgi:hypothetical protein